MVSSENKVLDVALSERTKRKFGRYLQMVVSEKIGVPPKSLIFGVFRTNPPAIGETPMTSWKPPNGPIENWLVYGIPIYSPLGFRIPTEDWPRSSQPPIVITRKMGVQWKVEIFPTKNDGFVSNGGCLS